MTEKKPTHEKAPTEKSSQSHRPVIRQKDNWGVSFALAVVVHCMLFVGLFVVFQWNRESDEVVYAELWAPTQLPKGAPVTAKPVAEEKPAETQEEPEPTPAPEPEQKPEPQPEETPPAPQPPEKAAPPLQEETEKRVEETPEDVIRQQDEEKKREEQKKLEEQKRLEEQQRLEEEKRLEAERQARVREQAKQLARRLQQEQMKQLEASSQSNVAGVMASGGRISAQYTAQIIGCIRPNIIFTVPPNTRRGQYVARYEVALNPNGEQKGAPRQLKTSGLPAFDLAVERAIEQCNPFPLPPSGRAYETIQLTFDPVDSNNR